MDNNVVVYIKQTFNEIGLGTTYNDVLKKKLGAFDVIDVPLFPELKKLLNTELVTFTLNSTMTATIDYDDPDKFKKVMTSGNFTKSERPVSKMSELWKYDKRVNRMVDNKPHTELEVIPIATGKGRFGVPVRKNVFKFFATPVGKTVWDTINKEFELNVLYEDMISVLQSKVDKIKINNVDDHKGKDAERFELENGITK